MGACQRWFLPVGHTIAVEVPHSSELICPHCSTPNPQGTVACLECSESLSDSDQTMMDASSAELMGMTVDTPRSFAQWAKSSSQAAAAAPILPVGLAIGNRYRVVQLLGRGGMGAVYQVHDEELDRDVALKLIRPDVAQDGQALERFKREIQVSSRITHRNVLRVYDLGETESIKYLTMQLVHGEDLAHALKHGKHLPNDRLLKILRQVCEGLAAAHEQGVVHRDLKPQNVMLGPGDHVYLTDFGLAKSAEQSAMTQTGTVLGTPFYMSPEQVKGVEVDHRSDIYSLGVIVYQMATGKLPFTGNTPYEVMAQRLQRTPTPARELNPEVPVFLGRILERCLQVDPSLRYQTVAEILEDLEGERFTSTLRYRALKRRWLKPAAIAAVAAAILLGAGYFFARKPRSTGSAAAPAGPIATR